MDGHHSAGVEGQTCGRRGPSPRVWTARTRLDPTERRGNASGPWPAHARTIEGAEHQLAVSLRLPAMGAPVGRAVQLLCPSCVGAAQESDRGKQGSSCRQDPRSVFAMRNRLRLNALDRWGGRAYRRVGASVGERPVPDQPGEVVEQQRGRKREVRRLAGPSRVGAECVRPRRGTPGRPGLRGAPAAVAAVARSSRPIAWTRTGSADRGVHRAPQWARDRSQIRVRGILPWLSPVKGHVPTIGCPKWTPIISRCTAAPTPSAVQRRT